MLSGLSNFKIKKKSKILISDFILAFISLVVTLYIFFDYEGLVYRQGILAKIEFGSFVIPYELIIGALGVVLLLEATRRAIGIPLVAIALIFLLFSVFGQSMPYLISHQGLSITRLVGYHWFGGEAIFGIPISVSVSFIFLFVLFGAILDAAGGGRYFINLAFALVGKMRGGPAKAAILASGLTGLISGSSVANTVTTGTFTIPIMKKSGLPAVKAGAVEVAASVNGQIMPPIMGAAAFVMAELLGISYFTVITHALLPAFICYIALFYISHLESVKLNIRGLPESEIPPLGKTFLSGIHYLIPIFILVYLLLIERWTASSSVFYSILSLMVIILVREALAAKKNNLSLFGGLKFGINEIIAGLEKGAINMINVAIAIATAGIIVGAVASTGLSNNLIIVVEAIAGDNVIILLSLTAVLCIILGMGLPTTANYLVVAALMAHVVVEVGAASGYVFPLIAVHLYVFYFGLMADVTPPVGLASYAASAISKADPIKTGIQAFWYELRTAILPVVFIFNNELLLIGIENFWHGLMVITTSLIAILVFSSATQGWFINKLRWHEIVIFILISLSLFRPDYVLDKFYPKYEYTQLQISNLQSINLQSDRDVHIRVTRRTEYGDRYKLFVINKDSFKENYSLEDYGFNLVNKEGRITIDALKWGGHAKKSGIEIGDVISEFKIENLDRPNRATIYPFSLLILFIFGYLNYRRGKKI
jgi:TRAP transporter 4TM/12TM fusion protein